jgi:hypothetical protein
MIISDITFLQEASIYSLRAKIETEDASNSYDVYVETEREGLLTNDANGWLLAAYMPAWEMGEKEIVIEGVVCPVLVANLKLASSLFALWYKGMGRPPEIRAEALARRVPAEEAAVFMSAGLDSIYSLYDLTEYLPVGHPKRPSAGLLIDYRWRGLSDAEAALRFEERQQRCRILLESRGLRLETIRTNLRILMPGGNFWTRRYHGAMLAAMAHFCSARLGECNISSSIAVTYDNDIDVSYPWGSHPMLDPLFSSAHMEIKHYGMEVRKADKVRMLGEWPEGLLQLHVCTSKQANGRNCGRCKKCTKTKMYLVANGLEQALAAFDYSSFSGKDIRSIRITSDWMYRAYELLAERFKENEPDSDRNEALAFALKRYRRRNFYRRIA